MPGPFEHKFSLFQNYFTYYLNLCCPFKTKKNSTKPKKIKWITQGILISRERLKFYSEIVRTTSNLEFKAFYRRYKAIYRKVIKAAKAYDVTSSLLNSKNLSKTAWQIINKSKSQSYSKQINLIKNDKILSDPLIVANEFNNFFAAVAKSIPDNAIPKTLQNLPSIRQPMGSLVLAPVVEEEVASVIHRLSPKRSEDLNGLSTWLVKLCAPYILRPLTILVNLSFESGEFPSTLKMAKVIPIFKKDNPSHTNNYRPISILPILSKVFEKLYLERLTQFLESNNLLSKQQFGFRSGKSTADAIVSLADMIVEGLEGHRPTLGVFLDLSKAFDCVDHNLLLDKASCYGIRGVPLQWLKSYLHNRMQVVQISNQLSESKILKAGVPQGSILSPLLFLIYVNDIDSSLHQGRLVQYADDTTLCISQKTIESLEVQTYLELNNCIQRFRDLNLHTNSSKSKFVHFCLRQNESENSLSVMIDDSPIESVNAIKFLGILFDKGLTWKEHVASICSRVASNIFVLRHLASYCPTHILIMAYYGLIYPHLTYGIAIWGGCATSEFNRLFRLQKRAIRIIKKMTNRESCRVAFKELKILTLPCLYILETCWFCKTKCTLTQGRDVHNYLTRGRENYRLAQHRTVVNTRLPSQSGIKFLNKLPNEIWGGDSLLKGRSRLKNLMVSQAFYSVGEFLEQD